jgi:ATP-dependent exoDNAse (exonuclease V) alpha subunit
MLASWDQYRRQHPAKSQLMLAFTRKEVSQINSRARTIRKAAGELGPDHLLKTSTGKLILATGDQIYFTKGNRDHGVLNGTIGTVTAINGAILTVRLANGTGISFDSKAAYRDGTPRMDFTHGYATTINKSQGATVDRALVLASHHMNRHATYVALSRHRDSVELHWAGEDFYNFQSLSNSLSRKGNKDTTLDYAARRKFTNKADLWTEHATTIWQTAADKWQGNRAEMTAGDPPRDRMWRAARMRPGQIQRK